MKNKASTRAFARHPFIIVLGVIVIAWSGYVFGQWLHGVIN